MADYWIKLYMEILDDPKMGTLPDRLWRRCIELFLLAGKLTGFRGNGNLPTTQGLAWTLRMPTDELELDMTQLETTGIIERTLTGWNVVNFAKRQARVPDLERKRQQRERERQENKTLPLKETDIKDTEDRSRSIRRDSVVTELSRNVTEDTTPLAPPSQLDSIREGEYPPANPASLCESVYRKVTGQPSIPADNRRNDALRNLETVLESYSWKIDDKMIDEGKQIFAQWCSTISEKTGRGYSRLNTAWLGKWLEQLAPVPEATHGIGQQTDLERAMARIHAAAQEG